MPIIFIWRPKTKEHRSKTIDADKDGDMVADGVEDGEQDASATGRTDTSKLVMVLGW